MEEHSLGSDTTTNDYDLYELYHSGQLRELAMYTRDEILSMDLTSLSQQSNPTGNETAQAKAFWNAIDQSGVLSYLSMSYNRVRSEAGTLTHVYMTPDEFLFYNFVFDQKPDYAFDFDADFSDAVGATDFFELDGVTAERYVSLSTPCRGVSVSSLNKLGFTGSVNARELGATVSDFMDDGELWFAYVVRNGRLYYFYCEPDGTVTENDAFCVISRWN